MQNPQFDVNSTEAPQSALEQAQEAGAVIGNNEGLNKHEINAVVKMVSDLGISMNEVLENNLTYTDLVKRWAKKELEKLRAAKAVEDGNKAHIEAERQLGADLLSSMIPEGQDYSENRLEKRSNELVAALADLEKFEIEMGYTTKDELKQEAAVAAARDVVTSAALGQYKMPDFGSPKYSPFGTPRNRAERRAAAKMSRKKGR